MKRIGFTVLTLMVVLAALDCALWTYAATKGNIRYEVTDDRVVVSCMDGRNPILRTAPRPKGGYYAVVVCEGKD